MTCPHCGLHNASGARFCGSCGRAMAPTATGSRTAISEPGPSLIGREIAGRYRMVAKLGEGGMGAVYRAEQMSLRRAVAIKLLRPELSADPSLVRRFNIEAELAAKLSHPNTVNIYDFGQDVDGTLFIAMEYVEGKSLRHVVQAGAMPLSRLLPIAAQIASSLTHAHMHGIVHRDLKPDNIMLTERGREHDIARVLDFGIAKLRDDTRQTQQAMTQAGDLIGTPQYMAPEQIRGDAVDGRTDVYALGAMLYELSTGRLPFEGATVMAILSKHLTEVPMVPSVRRPDLGLPPELDALVMSALAKSPADRPPSMENFGESIAELIAQFVPVPSVQRNSPSAPPPSVQRVHPPSSAPPPSVVVPRPQMAVQPMAPVRASAVAAAVAKASQPNWAIIGGALVLGASVVAATIISKRHPAASAPTIQPLAASASPLAGQEWRSSQGWGMLVPYSLKPAEAGDNLAALGAGGEQLICTMVPPGTSLDVNVLAASFARDNHMQIVPELTGMEMVLGKQRPHGMFVDPSRDIGAEAVAYSGPGYFFECHIIAPRAIFNAIAELRTEIFDRRVLLPK